jgi:hypothetical protein
VRHVLPPPNYLADGRHYTAELEARWVPEIGIYALHCPPDNDYAATPAYPGSNVTPDQLLDGCLGARYWGGLIEAQTLLCLPHSDTEAGTLAPGTSVTVQPYKTRDGIWYLVSTSYHYASEGRCPLLVGWSRALPPLKE